MKNFYTFYLRLDNLRLNYTDKSKIEDTIKERQLKNIDPFIGKIK